MGEKPAQIEHEIELRRARMGRNIQDLQHRVAEMKDWRKQFERRPGAFMGLAFGAGVLISLALPNGNSRARTPRASGGAETRHSSEAMHLAWQIVDNVKSALVGLAAQRFTQILSEAIPGFRDEYRKSEAKTSATYAL